MSEIKEGVLLRALIAAGIGGQKGRLKLNIPIYRGFPSFSCLCVCGCGAADFLS